MNMKKSVIIIYISYFLICIVGSSSLITYVPAFSENSISEVDYKEKISSISSFPSELIFCGVFPIVQRPTQGPDRRDAFYIAVDEINAQTGSERILPLGVNIKAIALDDDDSALGGTAAAQTCISDGAHIVIGSSLSEVSTAMQNELKTIPIIQISYASSSPALSNRTTYPYFMRVAGLDSDQGFALIDLVDSFGYTKGALINSNVNFFSETASVFLSNWTGNIITHQTFSSGAGDVSTQVQALKIAVENDAVEFIHLSASNVDARTVIKEAFQTGLTNNENVTFIINDASITSATFAGDIDVENGMQNMIGTDHDLQGPNYQSFINTWNTVSRCSNTTGDSQITCGFARTGETPNVYAPLAYDAVYVAAKGFADAIAVNSSFSATPAETDQLLDALYQVTHSGAGKYIEFNTLGETHQNYQITIVNNSIFDNFGFWNGTASFSVDSITLPGDVEWYWNGHRFVPITQPTFSSISYDTFDKEVTIIWQATIDSFGHEINYSLYFSTDGGLSWEVFASDLSGTSYIWNVSSLTNGITLNIKIEAEDTAGFVTEYISETTIEITDTDLSSTSLVFSSKNTNTTSGITTTTGLETVSLLFLLLGIPIIRKRRNKY